MPVAKRGSRDEDELQTFTPVFDHIAAELGIIAAAVYGVIWRHEQMRHGYAHLGVTRMAELLNLAPRTVQRRLRELEERGRIRKISPATRSQPAGYVTVVGDGAMPQEAQSQDVCTAGHSTFLQRVSTEGCQKVTPIAKGMTESHSWDDSATPKDTIRIQPGPQDTPPLPPRDGGTAEACASAALGVPYSPIPTKPIEEEAPVRPRLYEVTDEEMFSLRRQAKALQRGRRFSGDATQLREAAYEYGAEAVEAAFVSAQRLGVRSVTAALEMLGVEVLDL